MGNTVRVRDIRTTPFFWINKALLDVLKPSWQGLITYTALTYFSSGPTCRNVGIKKLAAKVGVSEDTIKRGLADLEKKKAIRVKKIMRTRGGSRQQLPNEYTLLDIEEKMRDVVL